MWSAKPLIVIKKIGDNQYKWFLFLSNNRKKPTCTSPMVYTTAFRCRYRAKQFAAKLKTPLRLVDKENNLDEVLVIDETRLKNNEVMDDNFDDDGLVG
jgi:hypothetical protein